jgi:hypothetical protein
MLLMRRLFSGAALAALTMTAALAADVTGKWVGEMRGGPGGGMSITLNLKQDGAKLTGSIDGPGGEAMEIQNGKVDGDKISFSVALNDMTILHEGTVKGDEITLVVKMDGGPGEGPGPITLKRAK